MQFKAKADVFGVPMEVTFTYIVGHPGSYWEPAEMDEVEITDIVNLNDYTRYPLLAESLNEHQDESKHPIMLAIIKHMDEYWEAQASGMYKDWQSVTDA